MLIHWSSCKSSSIPRRVRVSVPQGNSKIARADFNYTRCLSNVAAVRDIFLCVLSVSSIKLSTTGLSPIYPVHQTTLKERRQQSTVLIPIPMKVWGRSDISSSNGPNGFPAFNFGVPQADRIVNIYILGMLDILMLSNLFRLLTSKYL